MAKSLTQAHVDMIDAWFRANEKEFGRVVVKKNRHGDLRVVFVEDDGEAFDELMGYHPNSKTARQFEAMLASIGCYWDLPGDGTIDIHLK